MNKLTPTPIKKIGRVVTGKTPSTAVAENFDGDYMFVTPTELHTNFMIERSEKTLTRRGLDSIRTNSINGLSIAVGCIGWDMGNVALINEECATNQQINSITNINADEYNPYYLYFWLLTKKAYLFQISTVTRTPILNKTTFEDVLVPLPSKTVQDKVASVLLPISRKIALNNAINTELENIARLLFEYWFVQFDFPNPDGKPYRSSGGEMEYSTQLKRDIPKGWRVDKLETKLNMKRGVEPGSEAYSEVVTDEETVPFIRVSDMGSVPALYISEVAANGTRCTFNDVLVSFDGSVGKVAVAMEGAYSTGIRKISPKDSDYSNALIYFIFQSQEIQKTIAKYAVGSNILHASGAIEHLLFPYGDEVVKAYMERVKPLYKKIIANKQQNKELIRLRDFLLPLLMNGQVTVADIINK